MSDVSVIGTGAMGSALVEGLKASGARVTVWNRTKEKAEALSGPTVRIAESVGEALMSSPLTIMSVSDHEVARTLIESMRQGLEGRVVASTSFVTPDQAQELGNVVTTRGGAYLDLEIAALPRQVRSGAGVFLVSGERAAFEANREGLERIGRVTYVNAAPASAYLSGMAVQLAFLPMAVGLLQGARIAESQDFSPTGSGRLSWISTRSKSSSCSIGSPHSRSQNLRWKLPSTWWPRGQRSTAQPLGT